MKIKRININTPVLLAIIFFFLFASDSYSQKERTEEYINLYNSGSYTKALETINKKLDDFI